MLRASLGPSYLLQLLLIDPLMGWLLGGWWGGTCGLSSSSSSSSSSPSPPPPCYHRPACGPHCFHPLPCGARWSPSPARAGYGQGCAHLSKVSGGGGGSSRSDREAQASPPQLPGTCKWRSTSSMGTAVSNTKGANSMCTRTCVLEVGWGGIRIFHSNNISPPWGNCPLCPTLVMVLERSHQPIPLGREFQSPMSYCYWLGSYWKVQCPATETQ